MYFMPSVMERLVAFYMQICRRIYVRIILIKF